MTKQILIIKQDGDKEMFDASKLRNSLEHSGAGKDETEKVIKHIEKELKDGMTTSEIYRHAFKILKQFEKPIAARYSMKRALLALGPSGYPFEDFIAEIFRAKGYDVKVGEIIQGACVKHEVDIIAQKDGKKIGAEIKFHNELGNRSDIKVALYVHSRFEDIRKIKRENDSVLIDEDWIITNTKFTSDAIQYGNCVGMKMVSWNYPKQGNLRNLIDETGVHPVTALTVLSQEDKTRLIKNKIVLCRNIKKNREILISIGFDEKKIQNIMEESQSLCGL